MKGKKRDSVDVVLLILNMMCVLFRRRECTAIHYFSPIQRLPSAPVSIHIFRIENAYNFFFQFHFSSSLLLTCHTLSMNEFVLTILGLCARLVYTLPYSSSCVVRVFICEITNRFVR